MFHDAVLAIAATALIAVSSPAAAQAATKADAIMYATQTCGYCAKAREHFRARGVTWDERDVETSLDAAREFKALGGKGTPVIVIGDEHIVGFQPQRIDAALARRAAAR